MTSNCTECGRKTPKKVYLCDPCINYDPDYGDYRTEWEIWDEKEFLKAQRKLIEELKEETALEEFYKDYLDHEDEMDELYWDEIVSIGAN